MRVQARDGAKEGGMSDRITQKLARERKKQDAARAFPKGATRKSLKAKAKRLEKTMIALVRTACVLRDMDCRISTGAYGMHLDQMQSYLGQCRGQSEWAHFGAHRRARTRGMAPLDRHTTAGSLMLCRMHHRAYDAGKLKITALTDRGCDGPLEFTC
jgi:hypothetical protein